MYKDTNKVLENIKNYFGKISDESFEVYLEHRYVDFISENYQFRVYATFIQARVEADFEVPIEKRLEQALSGLELNSGVLYDFTTKFVDKPLSSEYCVELAAK